MVPDAEAGSAGSRRWIVYGALILIAIGVLWTAWVVLTVLGARRDLQTAERELESVRATASIETLLDGSLDEPLDALGERIGAANERLSHPLLRPAKWLPVLGRQLESAEKISGAADTTLDVGFESLKAVRELLDIETLSGGVLVATTDEIATIAQTAHAELAELDLGPRKSLFGSLARARNELEAELNGLLVTLDRVGAAAQATSDMLRGPSSYVLLAGNNAEMRAGSGMFLSSGLLQFEGGAVLLSDFGRSYRHNLEPGNVELTGDYADRWGWLGPNLDWRNLAVTPRFDATGALAAQMWEAATGHEVDGVLAVDPIAVQLLLRATGPVEIGDETITAGGVVDDLLNKQYDEVQTGAEQDARHDRLGLVAAGVIEALLTTELNRDALITGLIDAVSGRHIMLWAADSTTQSGWATSGVAGELTSDSLAISLLNRGGDKLDYFMEIGAEIVSVENNGGHEVTVIVTFNNTTPEDVSSYVAGGTVPESPPRHYYGILTANLPGAATNGRIDGVDDLTVVGADGVTRVVGAFVAVEPGETVRRQIRFSLPDTQLEMRLEPGARVPPIRWSVENRRFSDGEAHTITL